MKIWTEVGKIGVEGPRVMGEGVGKPRVRRAEVMVVGMGLVIAAYWPPRFCLLLENLLRLLVVAG